MHFIERHFLTFDLLQCLLTSSKPNILLPILYICKIVANAYGFYVLCVLIMYIRSAHTPSLLASKRELDAKNVTWLLSLKSTWWGVRVVVRLTKSWPYSMLVDSFSQQWVNLLTIKTKIP